MHKKKNSIKIFQKNFFSIFCVFKTYNVMYLHVLFESFGYK